MPKGIQVRAVGYQVATRSIGLLASAAAIRMLKIDQVGVIGLILATSQAVLSIANLGTDYSYQVLVKSERSTSNIAASLLTINTLTVSIGSVAAVHILTNRGLSLGSFHLVMLTVFFWIEAMCSILYEPLLAEKHFDLVFSRVPLSTLIRSALIIPLGIFRGDEGVVEAFFLSAVVPFAVGIVSYCRVKILAFAEISFKSVGVFGYRLIKRGVPAYTVSLIGAIIFWPMLVNVFAGEGLSGVAEIRISQTVAQLFSVIPAAVSPLLLARASPGKEVDDRKRDLDRSRTYSDLYLTCCCATIPVCIISLFFLTSDKVSIWVILPSMFFIGGGVVAQGYSDIITQRAWKQSEMVLISACQSIGPIFALLAVRMFQGHTNEVLLYALALLISPLVPLFCLSIVDRTQLVHTEVVPRPFMVWIFAAICSMYYWLVVLK